VLITADLPKCDRSRAITMWFLSRYMCDFWFLVSFGWSDCLVNSAHVVGLTRFFSGKSNGKSVCFTSSALTGSLFCSSH